MINRAQQLRDKMNDLSTSRREYMDCWHEYQDIVFRQKVIDEEARKRPPPQFVMVNRVLPCSRKYFFPD